MLSYRRFCPSPSTEMMELLNSEQVRRHLRSHPEFNRETLRAWVQHKIAMDQLPGCRLREVWQEDQLAGWCGIQLDQDDYEIALVLRQSGWGSGKQVLSQIRQWGRGLFSAVPRQSISLYE